MAEEKIDLVKLVRDAFNLPGVKAAVLDVEAQELCEEVDNWLAAQEEEKANG